MAKKSAEKVTVSSDFAYESESDLNAKIAAFAASHNTAHGQRLAMDARRPLGPGKVRVTFRVVEEKGGKKR